MKVKQYFLHKKIIKIVMQQVNNFWVFSYPRVERIVGKRNNRFFKRGAFRYLPKNIMFLLYYGIVE